MNELTIKNAGPALLITDPRGCILSANATAGRMFACAEKDLPGKNAPEMLNGIIPGSKLTAMAVCQQLVMLPVAGTLCPALLSVNEMQFGQQIIFAVTLYTIQEPGRSVLPGDTKRANLLAQATAAPEPIKGETQTSLLREKELSRLKTRFISLASHEFRSPLSSIQLSAALIERYYDRPDKDKVFFHLHKIRLAVGDLTGMLEDFLCLERIDHEKPDTHPEEIDLPVLCKELIMEMRLQAKDGQRFFFEHWGGLTCYLPDRKMLRHCLVNLLSNAINYCGEDGLITLSSQVIDGGCVIQITDNGLGIPLEDQQHIFEPFFRAGNVIDKQGTGLGLSIVRRYCELMNGRIDFESVEDKGTTFTLGFPAADLPAFPVYS